MKNKKRYNIKISIADIIISFDFNYQPFKTKIKKILDKFIVKSDKIDISIQLNKVNKYKIYNNDMGFVKTDIIDNRLVTLLKWDINGSLDTYNNNGTFNIYKDSTDLLYLLKFILTNFLHKYNALLLHSSSIINEDFGLVGSGVSGSGKTTFAKKLETEGFTILHDEVTLVRNIDSFSYIYPSPFNYNPKHIVSFSAPKKLKSLFILKKNKENYSKKITLKNFYKEIYKVILSNKINQIDFYDNIFEIVNKLYENVEIKELSFNLNENLIEKL